MAKVIKREVWWTPDVLTLDIVSHKVYVEPAGTPINVATSPNITVDMPMTTVTIPDDWPDFPGVISEGDYLVGIASVDDAGNESDTFEFTAPFDLAVPGAPVDGGVRNA